MESGFFVEIVKESVREQPVQKSGVGSWQIDDASLTSTASALICAICGQTSISLKSEGDFQAEAVRIFFNRAGGQ